MFFRNAKKTQGDVYINEPIETDKEGNALTLMDIIACENNIVDDIDIKIRTEQLMEYLKKLPARERMIVELRYGLGGRKSYAQREIAKLLCISRSYVSRIEKKALATLRAMFPEDQF